MTLDTTVDGSPRVIEAAADWLRTTLAGRAEELGSTAFRERSRSGSSWEGAAGDDFRRRVGTLGFAADDTAAEARAVAGILESLAAAMRRAQEGMAQARAKASAGGLTVRGLSSTHPDRRRPRCRRYRPARYPIRSQPTSEGWPP